METDRDLRPKRVECVECGAVFHIAVGEQRFYERKAQELGRPFPLPKRCKPCRAERKANDEAQSGTSEVRHVEE